MCKYSIFMNKIAPHFFSNLICIEFGQIGIQLNSNLIPIDLNSTQCTLIQLKCF
jgi:hypothetical protein